MVYSEGVLRCSASQKNIIVTAISWFGHCCIVSNRWFQLQSAHGLLQQRVNLKRCDSVRQMASQQQVCCLFIDTIGLNQSPSGQRGVQTIFKQGARTVHLLGKLLAVTGSIVLLTHTLTSAALEQAVRLLGTVRIDARAVTNDFAMKGLIY